MGRAKVYSHNACFHIDELCIRSSTRQFRQCAKSPPPTQRENEKSTAKGGCKEARAKVTLVAAVAANLSLLFIFKYLGFAAGIAARVLRLSIPVPNITLPIGISFYTFQALSYIIDVYRNPHLRQKNLLHLGLYIAFFPQLIVGPIVRYDDIRAQIESRTHSIDDAACGVERFIIGLAKKVLIANTLARCADSVYALHVNEYTAPYAWLAAVSYMLQIYYDFSGYSDMAIGLGRIFGFRFRENFDHPYAALGIRDFWRRWHISLSSWFKDYLYIPPGGNRRGRARTILKRAATLFAVLFLWVLFRASTCKNGIKIMLKMLGLERFFTGVIPEVDAGLVFLVLDGRIWLAILAGVIFALPLQGALVKSAAYRALTDGKLGGVVQGAKYTVLVCLLVLSASSLASGAYNPFIYFRF